MYDLNELLAGAIGLASSDEAKKWLNDNKKELVSLLSDLAEDSLNQYNVTVENLVDSLGFSKGKGRFRESIKFLIKNERERRSKERWGAETGAEIELERDGKGNILPSQENIVRIIQAHKHIRLRFDEYTGHSYYEVYGDVKLPWGYSDKEAITLEYKTEHSEKDVTKVKYFYADREYELAALKLYLSQHFFKGESSWRALDDALVYAAYQNKINIYQDYMRNGLPEWDGVNRFDFLHRYAGVKNKVWANIVGHTIFLGMMARCFEPGYDYRGVVVLEGPQNSGKSRVCGILSFHPRFFTQFVFSKHSEGYEIGRQLQGMAVVEFPDLGGIHSKDDNYIKAFLSSVHDTNRRMHSNTVDHLERNCIFIITTNELGQYLKDPTGNTRYQTVHCDCEKIDVDGIIAELPQLYAQAKYLWDAGISPRLTAIEEAMQQEEVKPREVKPDLYYWLMDNLKLRRNEVIFDEHENWDDGFKMEDILSWMESETWYSSLKKNKYKRELNDILTKLFNFRYTQRRIPVLRKRIDGPDNTWKWRYTGNKPWDNFIDELN